MASQAARQVPNLVRTVTDQVVEGVNNCFVKRLQLVGVGYRAAMEKGELVMNLGFSHQVRMKVPENLIVLVEENKKLVVFGRDKCAVGDFSAAVRSWRSPEPYKGKGIKYTDEVILRKVGKKK